MIDKKTMGIYLHIPFCNGKCPYCDFYSFHADEELKERYLNVLLEKAKNTEYIFDTIYFGGGTPSCVNSDSLADIISVLSKTDNCEITVECNPSDISENRHGFDLKKLKKAGVNRISMGMQSAVDKERRALGRRAGKDDVTLAIHRINEAGIDNISLDLMMGIPGQTEKSLEESLKFCINSDIRHISSYILKLEEGTYFFKNKDKINLPDDETVSNMYLNTVKYLKDAGFNQYEISNFSLPGFESKHNLKYWHCRDYLGLGPGAHSFIDGKRFYYPRNIEDFMAGNDPIDDGEGGNKEEYVMLALRLNEGLNYILFEEKYGYSPKNKLDDFVGKLVKNNLAVYDENSLKLTPEGFLISNSIIGKVIDLI